MTNKNEKEPYEENEPQEEAREFIREKIVRPPLTPRQILYRVVFFVCLAVMFGAISAVVFAFVRPAAEKQFSGAEESSSIEFADDETEAVESQPEETMEAAAEEQRIDEAVSEAVADYTYSEADVAKLTGALSDIADRADQSVITLLAGVQQTDIFGNPVESTGKAAGIVIAKTENEALILCSARLVLGVENMQVLLRDGTQISCQVRQNDSVLGLTVFSISLADLTEEERQDIVPAQLGSSYTVGRGDILIAVGSPAGQTYSTAYGSVMMTDPNVSMPDFTGELLYSDAHSSSVGTYFLNTSGELIGWADNSTSSEDSGLTQITAISPLKKTLENLTNGREIPYFGVRMEDVTEEMREAGIPAGVHVTEAVADSPAYASGIQNGDIIVSFNGSTVTTAAMLEDAIAETTPGTAVPVTIMRAGRDGYEQVSFTVEIRKR